MKYKSLTHEYVNDMLGEEMEKYITGRWASDFVSSNIGIGIVVTLLSTLISSILLHKFIWQIPVLWAIFIPINIMYFIRYCFKTDSIEAAEERLLIIVLASFMSAMPFIWIFVGLGIDALALPFFWGPRLLFNVIWNGVKLKKNKVVNMNVTSSVITPIQNWQIQAFKNWQNNKSKVIWEDEK